MYSRWLRAGWLSFGVGGGGGDLRMGVLQALQMDTSLVFMRPSLKGVGFRGDLIGDSAGSSRPAGRLFERWVRPERDLLRSLGAMLGIFACSGRVVCVGLCESGRSGAGAP